MELYTNISKFCKVQGMTYEEFKAYKAKIDQIAQSIFDEKVITAPSGLFFPVDELLSEVTDEQEELFVIQGLKKRLVEFWDNCTLWRY